MSTDLRERSWYRSADGTRWIRDKARKKPPKVKMPDESVELAPFLKGEAEGDFQLAVLLAMRELIRVPSRYIRYARAVSKTGQVTEPEGSDARKWSIFGALLHFTHPFPRKERTAIIGLIKQELPEEQRNSLMKWEEENNSHFQVIRLLSHTIDTRKTRLKYQD